MSNYFFNFSKMEYLTEKKPDKCILCLISEDSTEVKKLKVWQNDLFVVSVNLYPYNPGHLIIFPKRHITDIREFSHIEEHQLITLTRSLLNIIDKTHTPAAYNIGYNMGPVAGASISHLHRHIIPRYPREIGIADLIAGKKVLVEDPKVTCDKIKTAILENPIRL